MSIGETIKVRRESLNIQQTDAAKAVGVTVQTYSKWENDKTEPKASQVHKLAKLLKISEKYICQGYLPQKSDDPYQFIRSMSSLNSKMNNIDFIMTIWQNIEDDQHMIDELIKVSGLPEEMFNK